MARQVAALRYISQFQAKQSLVLFLNSVCLAEMQQINFLLSLDWPDWAWSHKLAHYTTIIYPNNGNIRNIHNIKQFHHTCFSQSMKRKSFKMFLITQVTFLQSLVLIGMVGLWEKDSLVEFLSWSGLKVNVRYFHYVSVYCCDLHLLAFHISNKIKWNIFFYSFTYTFKQIKKCHIR
jgi:hypothetical protein